MFLSDELILIYEALREYKGGSDEVVFESSDSHVKITELMDKVKELGLQLQDDKYNTI